MGCKCLNTSCNVYILLLITLKSTQSDLSVHKLTLEEMVS